MSVILESRGLTKHFGSVVAADGIDVEITEASMVGMIGANGAGKTTFLNIITGYVKPSRGSIRFRGSDITGLPPRKIASLGITRSFQIPQLFTSLTLLENVLIALSVASGQAQNLWRPLKDHARTDEALRLLHRFGLEALAHHAVDTLPEGGRKLLDIALTLVRKPDLLLLDEPTSSVSAKDKFEVFDVLAGVLRADAVTTIFVEHDMEIVSRYAEHVLALYDGKVIARGAPKDVLTDPEVRRLVVGLEE